MWTSPCVPCRNTLQEHGFLASHGPPPTLWMDRVIGRGQGPQGVAWLQQGLLAVRMDCSLRLPPHTGLPGVEVTAGPLSAPEKATGRCKQRLLFHLLSFTLCSPSGKGRSPPFASSSSSSSVSSPTPHPLLYWGKLPVTPGTQTAPPGSSFMLTLYPSPPKFL